jgi:hypothetical protein
VVKDRGPPHSAWCSLGSQDFVVGVKRSRSVSWAWAHASWDNAKPELPGGDRAGRHRLCIRSGPLDTRRVACPRFARRRRRGLSQFLDDSTGIPGTSYQKHTLLTLQPYGVMSASECRSWRPPRMSVRQCLCRADNRPDSLSLQRGQGTVGARSPPIPKSAETLPKMLPVADRSSLVLRVEQAEGPYPPSLPRGAARPVGVLLTRPS